MVFSDKCGGSRRLGISSRCRGGLPVASILTAGIKRFVDRDGCNITTTGEFGDGSEDRGVQRLYGRVVHKFSFKKHRACGGSKSRHNFMGESTAHNALVARVPCVLG